MWNSTRLSVPGRRLTRLKRNYRTALNLEDVAIPEIREGTEISGTVDAIESAVVGGNTCYYFTLKGSRQVYTAEISVSELLPFLKADER